jgi:hypothetical protein
MGVVFTNQNLISENASRGATAASKPLRRHWAQTQYGDRVAATKPITMSSPHRTQRIDAVTRGRSVGFDWLAITAHRICETFMANAAASTDDASVLRTAADRTRNHAHVGVPRTSSDCPSARP